MPFGIGRGQSGANSVSGQASATVHGSETTNCQNGVFDGEEFVCKVNEIKLKRAWFDDSKSSKFCVSNSTTTRRKVRSRSESAKVAIGTRSGCFSISSANRASENEPTHLTMDEIRSLMQTRQSSLDSSAQIAPAGDIDTKDCSGRRKLSHDRLPQKAVAGFLPSIGMRKPQPVKIFDCATCTRRLNATTCHSSSPLSFLFRGSSRPSAATCDPDDGTSTRSRPESAPASELFKMVRTVSGERPDTPKADDALVLKSTQAVCNSDTDRDDLLSRRLNYVLLVNEINQPAETSESAVAANACTCSNAINTSIIPKRSFTQKLRRLFSIKSSNSNAANSSTPTESDAPVADSACLPLSSTISQSSTLMPVAISRSGAGALNFATRATAFRAVQPRLRPSGVPVANPIATPTDDSSQNHNSFLTNLTELRERGWYWGPLSSEQAERLLADKEDGSFLVRDSSHEMYILSLSFRSNGITGHVRIEHQGGKFRFTSEPASYHAAASVVEFVQQAMEYSRGGRYQYFVQATAPGQPPLPVTLLRPVSRFEKVARLQHLCRYEILKHTRCDHVDALPLPTTLKHYLRQKQFYFDTSILPGESPQD